MPARVRASRIPPASGESASVQRAPEQWSSMRCSMARHGDECVLEVCARNLQVRYLHIALEKPAQHQLGLVGQQLDAVVLDCDRADREVFQILLSERGRDKTHSLAGDP